MVDLLFEDIELAELYDYFTPTVGRSDFGFYFPSIMGADTVLDAGCGTGSLLKRARVQGHRGRLVGLDPAHGMLEIARRRHDIECVHSDLVSAPFRREFDLVVMTGHAFQVFLEDDEVRDALRAVSRALNHDGVFAFETRNPPDKAWERWPDEYSFSVEGADRFTYHMDCEVDTPVTDQFVEFRHTFSGPGWPGPRISRSVLRFMGPDELNSFLTEAGFKVEHQFGDWDRTPVTDKSPEIITIASLA